MGTRKGVSKGVKPRDLLRSMYVQLPDGWWKDDTRGGTRPIPERWLHVLCSTDVEVSQRTPLSTTLYGIVASWGVE
jgi:hypothetical protein